MAILYQEINILTHKPDRKSLHLPYQIKKEGLIYDSAIKF